MNGKKSQIVKIAFLKKVLGEYNQPFFELTKNTMKKSHIFLLFSISISFSSFVSANNFFKNQNATANYSGLYEKHYSNSSFNQKSNYLSFGIGGASLADSNKQTLNGAETSGLYSYSNGNLISLALGKKINSYRFELEYFQTKNDLTLSEDSSNTFVNAPKNSNLSVKSLFLNLYFDYQISPYITPYISLGVGTSNLTTNYGDQKQKDNGVLGTQAKIGISFLVSKNASLYLNYRYFKTQDFMSINQIELSGVKQNVFEAGFQVGF